MERDIASEKGGEQAAWRDLVARLESPASYDPACAPWPDRENVPDPGIGPGDRGRVIRPAGSLPLSADTPGTWPHGHRGDREDPEDREDLLDVLDALDQDDADGQFVPPPVGPLPRHDAVTRGAWAALFGGPAYLFVAALFGWQLSGWSELAAIGAFVAGFLVLVFRLGEGPSRRDGPDQGAVV